MFGFFLTEEKTAFFVFTSHKGKNILIILICFTTFNGNTCKSQLDFNEILEISLFCEKLSYHFLAF